MQPHAMRRSVTIAAVGGLLNIACASATNEQLVRRAAFDMRCPEAQIQAIELDSKTRGVRGCGQQATYVEMCDGTKDSAYTTCTWVLNTRAPNEPAGSARTSAPPPASSPSASTAPTSPTSANQQPLPGPAASPPASP